MNNYDDIIEDNSNNKSNYRNNYSNNYKKNNWQEQQNKERQEIYDTIGKMTELITKNGEEFKNYLDIQSKFEKYSVGNCLLILNKFPSATQFRDKKAWEEKGYKLIDNAKSITILEPNRSETNNRVYYNPKYVFDISQTNSNEVKTTKEYDDRTLLKAFLNNCTAKREAVDILPNSDTKGAEYDKDKNVLYVCRGLEREVLFQSLAQELSSIEMKDSEESNLKSFKSYCTSYMLCKQYGIDVSNYDFKDLPEEINKQKGKDVRNELDSIRINYEKLNARIKDYLENSSKEKKAPVPER